MRYTNVILLLLLLLKTFSGLLIAFYTLLELGPILGPEVPGSFLFDGEKPRYVHRS